MINDMIKVYQDNILLYKQDKETNYDKLVDSVLKLDNEYTLEYLTKLKEYANKSSDIEGERNRIREIVSLMEMRLSKRSQLINDLKELDVEVSFLDIPNIDKIDSFKEKLEVMNKHNDDSDVDSILSNSEVSEKIEEKFERVVEDDSNSIKILKDYYDSLDSFPNLNVPNMGLVKDKDRVELDNNSFFLK